MTPEYYDNNQPYKTVYRRGAEDGLLFGTYLSVMFLAACISLRYPQAAVIQSIMFFGVPFLIYWFLRRSYKYDHGMSKFSALWMHGIMIFVCGSLIMALVMFIYMRFIRPEAIHTFWEYAINTYTETNTPQGLEAARMMREFADRGMLPSPISVAFSMIWLTSFTGSILSMIISLIVRAIRIKPPKY